MSSNKTVQTSAKAQILTLTQRAAIRNEIIQYAERGRLQTIKSVIEAKWPELSSRLWVLQYIPPEDPLPTVPDALTSGYRQAARRTYMTKNESDKMSCSTFILNSISEEYDEARSLR